VLAVALLAPAMAFAVRRRGWTRREQLELLALCGAVSLLAVRHLSYDFVLLWPAIAGGPSGFLLLAGAMIADIPAWARLASAHGGAWAIDPLTQADRVVAVGAWVALSWRLWSARRTAAVPGFE